MKHSKLIVLLAGSTLMLAGTVAEAQSFGGGRGGHHGAHRGGAGHALMMLRAADANGDNSITRAEVDALQAEMFDWMDRNGDGFLDEADQSPMRARLRAIHAEDGEDGEGRRWRRHRGGPDGGRDHMRADANEDGRISRAEFLGRENRIFNRLDSDESGVVTPEELDAAAERRQDRRFWWRD
jgi:hypothetical protein